MIGTVNWTEGKPEFVQSGMLLKCQYDEKTTILLVGDVNDLMGQCNCCTDYEERHIIAYAQILEDFN